ncbi:MAG: hypothetical protein WCO45_11270 [Pseudanabaena sp. ELA607]
MTDSNRNSGDPEFFQRARAGNYADNYQFNKSVHDAFNKEQQEKALKANSKKQKPDFSERARKGDYVDNQLFAEAARNAFDKAQVVVTLQKGRQHLKTLSSSFLKATSSAYPHLMKRRELMAARRLLQKRQNQNSSPSQDPITSLFLGVAPFVLFTSVILLLISPTSGIISIRLVLSSIVHALVICTGVLVLAAFRNDKHPQKETASNKISTYRLWRQLFRDPIRFITLFPIWNVISIVLAIVIMFFCVVSSQEKLSIALLIGFITLLSTLAICFGGKGGFLGIQYIYFLVRNVWLSIRITAETFQIWLPRRLYGVETTLQEYINLANQYNLPIGPFSKATGAVLTEWYGYNPFPSSPPEPPAPLATVPRNPNNSPSQVQLDEAEPPTNAPESVEDQEYFSNPVDRRIRDAESEI